MNDPSPIDQPLGRTRSAQVGVLSCDDDFAAALTDAFTQVGRSVVQLTPESLRVRPWKASGDPLVIFVTIPWDTLETLLNDMASPLADAIVVICTTAFASDSDGFFMRSVPAGSVTETVNQALPQSHVVGALQQFAPDHIVLASMGAFESDAPVVGDHLAFTGIVESLIDELRGFESVYAGGLQTASAVEGLTVLVRELARRRRQPVGFRLDNIAAGGLRFLD